MTWNYRICKQEHKTPEGKDPKDYEGKFQYGIHETYYNKLKEVCGVTEECMNIQSHLTDWDCTNEQECIDSIKTQLEWMSLAVDKPVLDLDTIIWAQWDDDLNEDDDVNEDDDEDDEMASDIEELMRD